MTDSNNVQFMIEMRNLLEKLEENPDSISYDAAGATIREAINRLENAAAALSCANGRMFYLNIEGTATHADVLLMDQAIVEAQHIIQWGAGKRYRELFGLESNYRRIYDETGNYRTDVAVRSDGVEEEYDLITVNR